MPSPSELLSVAKFLSTSSGSASPSDAHLRRAVSTAYYAVFHRVSLAAATRFIGHGQEHSPGFATLYRAFNHGDLKKVFEALSKTTLSEKYRDLLQRAALSQDMRAFAAAFPSLKVFRHLADYHPAVRFSPSEVLAVINEAEFALEAFDRIAEGEKTDVLALLLAGSRS